MKIGVDFDNTIICYDKLFYKVARERCLIPDDLPANKSHIRDYLRRKGQEDVWTEMQGYVYGKRIIDAEPFPGVIDFFRFCKKRCIPIYIVSHKTLYPYKGIQYNLHDAAYEWLEQCGFFTPEDIGLTRKQVFLELTKEEKIYRIKQLGCTHFIDDLPEFLCESTFPSNVMRILFDPANNYKEDFLRCVSSWMEIQDIFNSDRSEQF